MEPGQRESFTVMILRNTTSKSYRFSMSRKKVQVALIAAAAVSVLLVFFMVRYFDMASSIGELALLRKETATQQSKIEAFATTVDGLKQQLEQLKEFDAKIRMITDLKLPEDGSRYLGLGGERESSSWSRPEASIIPEGGVEDPIDDDDQIFTRSRKGTLVETLEHDLSILTVDTSRLEQSFQGLTAAIEDRRNRWAATPSIWPVKGWMTSGFGRRISPFTGRPVRHRGIDIAVPKNTPLVAAADGVVTWAGWNGGFGRTVKIKHGYGYETLYAHLEKVRVKVGQRVERGQEVGLVGNTGRSTGTHLHYEVHVNRVAKNPVRYILN